MYNSLEYFKQRCKEISNDAVQLQDVTQTADCLVTAYRMSLPYDHLIERLDRLIAQSGYRSAPNKFERIGQKKRTKKAMMGDE